MTETEIMGQVVLNEEAHQAIYQWWVSITFGFIALAHFGRKQLTFPLVTLVTILYVAATLGSAIAMSVYLASINAYFNDLEALNEAASLAQGTEAYIRSWRNPWQGALFGIGGLVAFVGAIAYLIYRYRSSKRSEAS